MALASIPSQDALTLKPTTSTRMLKRTTALVNTTQETSLFGDVLSLTTLNMTQRQTWMTGLALSAVAEKWVCVTIIQT